MAEPIPLPLRALSPVAPIAAGRGVMTDVHRGLRGNRFVAAHFGSRRTSTPIAVAIIVATLATATLARFVIAPTIPTGLLAVSMTGLAAWRCAAATGSDRPTSANDNPRRAYLPPGILSC